MFLLAHRRALAAAFAGALSGWTAALVAAPYAVTHQVAGVAGLMTALAYLIGGFLCHQLPDRSFHAWGAQLPVCARCFGLYAGAAVGAFVAFAVAPNRRELLGHDLVPRFRRLLLAAACPTAFSIALEWTGVLNVSDAARALAAVPLGAACAVVAAAWIAGYLR